MQTFTEHSCLADPGYPALLEALLEWAERGVKPQPQAIARRCAALEAAFGPGCRFVDGYRPPALETRVAPRQCP